MNKKPKKKTALFLILLLVLIVPILITLFVLELNLSPDLRKGNVRGVTLVYDGKDHVIEEKDQIENFIQIAESGEEIGEAANPLSEYRKCEMIFHKINRDVEYVFYLSDSVHNCIYTDPEGIMYLLPEKTASKLLSHKALGGYAVSYASYPTMTFTQGGKNFGAKEISGEWTYEKMDKGESAEIIKEKSDAVVILPQGENLNFAFSIDPDFCSITLQNEKGEIMYSGDPAGLTPVTMEKDTTLSLVAKCDWYEDNHEEYYGSLTYTFDIFYDIPTSCTLDRQGAAPGEMITLTVSNSSSEDIVVTTTFAAGQIQKLKTDGVWQVLIPIAETATAGEFSMMVMGLDVEETFPITIAPLS